jgi:hypothetical protein
MKIDIKGLAEMFNAKPGDTIAVRFPGGIFVNGKQVSPFTPQQLEGLKKHEFGAGE